MNRFKMLVAGMAFLGAVHAAEPNPTAFEMTLVDMQGQKKVLGTVPGSVFSPRVSPEGRRVAFEQLDPPAGPGEPELLRLYVGELTALDKRRPMQETVSARRNLAPIWSPDGDWLAFLASGNGPDALYYQRSDGGIQPKYLIDGRAVEGWYDGGKLAFITLTGNRDYGISLLDTKTKQVTRLVDQPGTEQHSSRISPDGRWLAYASNETGRQEVWLEPLPQTGKRYQLTKQGGRHPLWSPDGKKLYFDQDGRMFRLDLSFAAEPGAGEPVALPITGFQQGDLRRQYDLMPDGSGFVMLFPVRAAR
jgi:eukaryotic-like serine/threonine-protein kinase